MSKAINEKLVVWIEEKVKREYAEDISLVLLYGSFINGTANPKSDIDCYFIPRTERGYELAKTFIAVSAAAGQNETQSGRQAGLAGRCTKKSRSCL